jgi:hypothetical protein
MQPGSSVNIVVRLKNKRHLAHGLRCDNLSRFTILPIGGSDLAEIEDELGELFWRN